MGRRTDGEENDAEAQAANHDCRLSTVPHHLSSLQSLGLQTRDENQKTDRNAEREREREKEHIAENNVLGGPSRRSGWLWKRAGSRCSHGFLYSIENTNPFRRAIEEKGGEGNLDSK